MIFHTENHEHCAACYDEGRKGRDLQRRLKDWEGWMTPVRVHPEPLPAYPEGTKELKSMNEEYGFFKEWD